MRRLLAAFALSLSLATPALAGVAEDIRATYLGFAEAQNARDAARIGSYFVDDPDFLWVSDGRSVWGRDATLARMGSFQKAETWRVEPDLDASTVVELAPGSAMLHLPLTLVIGKVDAPNRLRFLVSILFVERESAWKIAALLTTNEKR